MVNDRQLIAVAEALGIPWRRLLENEINAEREVQRSLGPVEADMPLWRVFAALQVSVLDSWRVRERIQALAWEVRTAPSRRARSDLRAFSDHLSGRRADRQKVSGSLTHHLELAYWRFLELRRAARAARKSRGDLAARVRCVVEQTGCPESDARWAVNRALEPGKPSIVEDAMRQARAEGFEIPRAHTEFQAWVLLRRFVRFGIAEKRHRLAAVPGTPTHPAGSRAPMTKNPRAVAGFVLDLASTSIR